MFEGKIQNGSQGITQPTTTATTATEQKKKKQYVSPPGREWRHNERLEACESRNLHGRLTKVTLDTKVSLLY